MGGPAVEIRGIRKTYPASGGRAPVQALKAVDLTVDRATVFCILGPNGAGKTTLISILCGLLSPDGGSGRVWGLDLVREQRKIRALVNFASGHANLPDNFTVDEMLAYFGMLYGLNRAERRRKAEELICLFELEAYRKVPFNQLSTGLKQRLILAKALLNEPRVLFLDEPTVGLDPQVTATIRARLLDYRRRQGTTIILTTHQMDEAEQMSDRIAFLREGTFVRIGGVAELKKSIRFRGKIMLRGRGLASALQALARIPGVSHLDGGPDQVSCRVDSQAKRMNAIVAAVLQAGGIIENIQVTEPTLGDVFIALSQRSDSD